MAGVVAVVLVYVVNVPSMQAAHRVIEGLRATNAEAATEAFTEGFEKTTMAQTEILRMSLDSAGAWISNPQTPSSTRTAFVGEVDTMVKAIEARRPLTAPEATSLYQFYARFDYKKARDYAAYAHEQGPKKIDLIIYHGVAEFLNEDTEAAIALWNEAYNLYPEARLASIFKAAAMVLEDRGAEIFTFFDEGTLDTIVQDDFLASIVYQREDTEVLSRIYERRIAIGAADERTYVTLSMLEYEAGKTEEALALIKEAAEKFPEYQASFLCAARNVENNDPIEQPCE